MMPPNLRIDNEPDYRIRVVHPNGAEEFAIRNNRSRWKRLSAIAHARHIARYNPNSIVCVELA